MNGSNRIIAALALAAGSAVTASAEWKLNSANNRLSDGTNWTLSVVLNSPKPGINVTGKAAGSGDLDFTDVETDTGYKVTYIGGFNTHTELKSLRMPDAIRIGDTGLARTGLTNVEFGVALETIDQYAFKYDSGSSCMLKSFSPTTLPNLTSIGLEGFLNAAALDVDFVFPRLTRVGESAFRGSGIRSVRAPNLTNIAGQDAFKGAPRLVSFYAPMVKDLPRNTFCYCNALADVTLLGGGKIGSDSMREVAGGAVIRFLGAAPTEFEYGGSGWAGAIQCASGDYPQIQVMHFNWLASWFPAPNGSTFTAINEVSSGDMGKFGNCRLRRTKGLLYFTGGGRAWLVDGDCVRHTIFSVR